MLEYLLLCLIILSITYFIVDKKSKLVLKRIDEFNNVVNKYNSQIEKLNFLANEFQKQIFNKEHEERIKFKEKINNQLIEIFDELQKESKINAVIHEVTEIAAFGGLRNFNRTIKTKRIFLGYDNRTEMYKLAYTNEKEFKSKYPSIEFNKIYNILIEHQNDFRHIKETIKQILLETMSLYIIKQIEGE